MDIDITKLEINGEVITGIRGIITFYDESRVFSVEIPEEESLSVENITADSVKELCLYHLDMDEIKQQFIHLEKQKASELFKQEDEQGNISYNPRDHVKS
jgi:hypothetical protein